METSLIREIQQNGQTVGLQIGSDMFWATGIGPTLTDTNGNFWRLIVALDEAGNATLQLQPITQSA